MALPFQADVFRRAFLPRVGEDCVTRSKNVSLGDYRDFETQRRDGRENVTIITIIPTHLLCQL